ncbi:methylated-DNA-[protein]-cysteine S-methyltransferase [Prauserella isguenensis]|uniref:Methylated-DNA-[protein]-cysteine S-methyltransferase n=1 Tax=Prauserella isguenensis TaxID=1470180 RepID=A0A839S4K5_9PSEU|nr:MGMT family protein [Prauserella isguenensis]MBB3052725.1 methylated-DNA-[protein]-cysteine S-methyltransferase [Prauserella isguenensis]
MIGGGGVTVFPTAIGHCGLAWAPEPAAAILGAQLPETDVETTRARLRTRFPDAVEHPAVDPHRADPGAYGVGAHDVGAYDVGGVEGPVPPWVLEVIDAVAASLAGEEVDLSAVPLNLASVPPFHARVYEVARTIPRGTTTTYGELARLLGEPGAAQAVGQALGANPFAPIVPCHRILAAGGKPGGFSAAGGVATKERILEAEGVHLTPPTLF